MPRRGTNSFRRADAKRAIQSARDGGIEPAGLEVIVAADGTTTFRVLGTKALPDDTREVMSAAEWDEAIEREKAAAKAKRLKE
jgi:hypothetical protein